MVCCDETTRRPLLDALRHCAAFDDIDVAPWLSCRHEALHASENLGPGAAWDGDEDDDDYDDDDDDLDFDDDEYEDDEDDDDDFFIDDDEDEDEEVDFDEEDAAPTGGGIID